MDRGRVKAEPVKLLDHGYLKPVVVWGDEEGIIEAARMSTNKGFLGWGDNVGRCRKCDYREANVLSDVQRDCDHDFVFKKPGEGDEKLLRFLYENNHATPFEMAGAIFEVQAPIFVFREWHRHRTQSYNEMSARYTPMPDVHFLPTVERCLRVKGRNKQANAADGAQELTHAQALEWLQYLEDLYAKSEWTYQKGLEIGIPKELARLAVTVSRYSRMRASTNLRNWLAFMTLRSAPAAQEEIQVYSNAVGVFLESYFPRTLGFFRERFG